MNRLEAFRCFLESISAAGIHRSNHGSVCHRHLAITLAVLVLALLITSSCSSTDHTRLAKSATTDTAEIFVHPAFGTDLRTKIAVIPFQAPSNAQQAGHILTETYYQELLRGGGFRQVTLVRELPPTQRHLPAWQVLKDYDLVLQGQIIHLLTGTGSTPTQLQVEIRIVDVARGTMAWYVKQQCVSRPGEDLDLILKTVPGEYAKPYQELASVLARKFVQIITTMPEKPAETRSEPPLGAQTPSGTGR